MNDQHIVDYLRSRGQVEPPLDLTRSVMAAVETAPARRSWFSAYMPAFAAVGAVAVVALLAALTGPGRDVGPPPKRSPTSSASATEQVTAGALEAAVTDALDRLAQAPGVQGSVTSTIEEYVASATWFDWRPNGDQVVVTRTDTDVSTGWWTDPDGEPLTVGERVETVISIRVGDEFYTSQNDAWVSDAEAPRGPLSFWTGVLEDRIPIVGGFPAGAQADRRDLADGTTVWVLVSGSDDGRTITEWTIGPGGVLRSVSTATEQAPTVEQGGSMSATVEFTPLEDPEPIPTPDIDAAPDPSRFGVPDDFPLPMDTGAASDIDYPSTSRTCCLTR